MMDAYEEFPLENLDTHEDAERYWYPLTQAMARLDRKAQAGDKAAADKLAVVQGALNSGQIRRAYDLSIGVQERRPPSIWDEVRGLLPFGIGR